ncbi:MAG: DUF4011 domain-containing protein [Methanomassiliicoccaceae archaeon]|nr:DUF4011 domain-containing protein [Methanomassiliicoccaceae archaeon]
MHTMIEKKIEHWKSSLIDLSKSNPLINRPEPAKSSRANRQSLRLEEDLAKLWKQFSEGDRPMKFAMPKGGVPDEEPETPEDRPTDAADRIRTLKVLRKKAKLFFEETGLNNLYLAFGFLRWKERDTGSEMRSPLILVPVRIEQENQFQPMVLHRGDDEVSSNPALALRLANDFEIKMPDLDPDMESIDKYFAAVAAACKNNGWGIEKSVELSFFSFLKINMYRDIEANAEVIKNHPIVRAIAGDQVPDLGEEPGIAGFKHDEVRPFAVFSVVDADSSQQDAIFLAKNGKSFVLQGPPGTGKSQTITNIIAELLADRKKVLFVSEKMAALDVVQKRLARAGLGDFCLTLHSHKTKREDVIEQLVRSLELAKKTMSLTENIDVKLNNLDILRRELNEYVREMNSPIEPIGKTIYKITGEISSLSDAPDILFEMKDVDKVTAQTLDNILHKIGGLSQILDRYGWQSDSPWKGTAVNDATYELKQRFTAETEKLSMFVAKSTEILSSLGINGFETFNGAGKVVAAIGTAASVLAGCDADILSLDAGPVLQRFKAEYKKMFKSKEHKENSKLIASRRKDKKELSENDAIKLLEDLIQINEGLGGRPPVPMRTADHEKVLSSFTVLNDMLKGSENTIKFFGDFFGMNALETSLEELRKKTEACSKDIPAMERWIDMRDLRLSCEELGLGDFISKIEQQKIDPKLMVPAFKKGFDLLWLDVVKQDRPAVKDFRRLKQDEKIREFRRLDSAHLNISRDALKKELVSRLPSYDSQTSNYGEYRILKSEIGKKRKYLPIRKLIEEVKTLLPVLKPCMMMSPLSVSTYLGTADYRFDTVIFDEASQVRTEDSIGAIFRADQVIIAGDSKQLPPTNFFAKMTQDEEFEDEDMMDDTGAYDSLLEEAAVSLPQRTLLWHYRSRHEHLIAFSNNKFYNNGLYTFPSSGEKIDGDGVEYIFVPDGTYDSGKGRKGNKTEAKKVAELVFEHFRTSPERSLGVIAFGEGQQNMIENEIQEMRRTHPEFEDNFNEDKEETFFVKNLETVQGDERDNIIFSIGFAPDTPGGKLRMYFGPLNLSGGERRLNVAVTRARYNVKLVGSIHSTDITTEGAAGEGRRLLRQYIDFAVRGPSSLGDISATAPSSDAPFENTVRGVLEANGYDVAPQVGCSTYRIDMAVRHPKFKGRYAIGIECDGLNYNSARTARERDRIRQSVLEEMGWKLYRVWSTDWIKDPKTESEQLIATVEKAIAEYEGPKKKTAKQKEKPKPSEEKRVVPPSDPLIMNIDEMAGQTPEVREEPEGYLAVSDREDDSPRSAFYGKKPPEVTILDTADIMLRWIRPTFGNMTKEELFDATMRSYGWTKRGNITNAHMEKTYNHMLRTKKIKEEDGKVCIIKK